MSSSPYKRICPACQITTQSARFGGAAGQGQWTSVGLPKVVFCVLHRLVDVMLRDVWNNGIQG